MRVAQSAMDCRSELTADSHLHNLASMTDITRMGTAVCPGWLGTDRGVHRLQGDGRLGRVCRTLQEDDKVCSAINTNALGKLNLAAIERIVSTKYRRGAFSFSWRISERKVHHSPSRRTSARRRWQKCSAQRAPVSASS